MKKLTPKFTGEIKSGKLYFDDRNKFDRYLLSLKGKVEIVVKKFKKERSLQQNKYYWSVVVPLISSELGYTREEMHEVLKSLFLKDHINFKGENLVIIRSTTDLKTDEFENYLSEIRIWASKELSIYVPEPNEINY